MLFSLTGLNLMNSYRECHESNNLQIIQRKPQSMASSCSLTFTEIICLWMLMLSIMKYISCIGLIGYEDPLTQYFICTTRPVFLFRNWAISHYQALILTQTYLPRALLCQHNSHHWYGFNLHLLPISAITYINHCTHTCAQGRGGSPWDKLFAEANRQKLFWTIFRQNGAFPRQIGVFPHQNGTFSRQIGGIYCQLACFILYYFFTPPPLATLTVHMYDCTVFVQIYKSFWGYIKNMFALISSSPGTFNA